MRKKNIDKWYHTFIDLYSVDVFLYVGDQNKMLSKQYEDFMGEKLKDHQFITDSIRSYLGSDDNDSNNWCMPVYDKNRHLHVIICVEQINSKPDIVGVLSHECLHAAIFICNFCGIRDDDSGFESLCYLQEKILTEFYKLKSTK